jgi:hypothetical protein
MKTAALLLFASVLFAQVRPMAETARPAVASAAGAPPPSIRVNIPPQSFRLLEDNFNVRIKSFSPKEPVYMLALTRGLYVRGFGVIFTSELDLIQSPTINPFHQKILPEEVVSTHERKMKQLPLLRQALRDEFMACAKSLDAVPPGEQMVLSVRLEYQGWENKAQLPGEIILRADRKSAMAGNIQVEEQ